MAAGMVNMVNNFQQSQHPIDYVYLDTAQTFFFQMMYYMGQNYIQRWHIRKQKYKDIYTSTWM